MKAASIITSVLIGTFFTHYCIAYTVLTPVLASALTGMIGSLAFHEKTAVNKDIGLAVYCGSFVGMGSALSGIELLSASIIAAVLMLFSTNLFKGFGGKLGFIAFIASVLIGFCVSIIDQNFSIQAVFSGFAIISKFDAILAIGLAAILGFYSTIYINHNMNKSAVLASSLPSFIIGFLAFTPIPQIQLFIATFFSASFAGMLSETRLQKQQYPTLIVILILISILLKSVLGNYGGALGTIAFIAVSVLVCKNKVVGKEI